jgi:hypothetical protein
MKRYNNSLTYLPRERDRHDLTIRVPLFEVVLGPISVGLNVVGVMTTLHQLLLEPLQLLGVSYDLYFGFSLLRPRLTTILAEALNVGSQCTAMVRRPENICRVKRREYLSTTHLKDGTTMLSDP